MIIIVNTAELKGLIAKKGYSQAKIAIMLNMAPKTFYTKMKLGRFDTDEAEKMIDILEIKNPSEIFFARE